MDKGTAATFYHAFLRFGRSAVFIMPRVIFVIYHILSCRCRFIHDEDSRVMRLAPSSQSSVSSQSSTMSAQSAPFIPSDPPLGMIYHLSFFLLRVFKSRSKTLCCLYISFLFRLYFAL